MRSPLPKGKLESGNNFEYFIISTRRMKQNFTMTARGFLRLLHLSPSSKLLEGLGLESVDGHRVGFLSNSFTKNNSVRVSLASVD